MNLRNMEKQLAKVSHFFDLAAKTICILSILAVFVLCIEQVVCRFLLHATVGYVDEVSRYLFILSVFVGSCLSVRDDEHFSLDLLHAMLRNRPKALAVVRIMVQTATGIFLVFMIRSGIILASSTTTQHSSYLQMPMSVIYWLIPVCGVWMMCYVVLKIAHQILILCSGSERKED